MMTEEDALKGENIEHIDATSQVDTNIVSETAEAGETSAPACPAASIPSASPLMTGIRLRPSASPNFLAI